MVKEKSARAREIIGVSAKLFAEHGYHGVSVRDICSELNLNFSIISYYFGGKEGLYRAVVQNQLEAVAGAFDQVALNGLNPREELTDLWGALEELKAHQLWLPALTARESGQPSPVFQELARTYQDRLTGHLSRLIRAGQRLGQFKNTFKAEVAAGIFFLLLNGDNFYQTFNKVGNRDQGDYQEVAALIFLEGMAEEILSQDAPRNIGKQTARPRGTFS